jgi:hypothetical protein
MLTVARNEPVATVETAPIPPPTSLIPRRVARNRRIPIWLLAGTTARPRITTTNANDRLSFLIKYNLLFRLPAGF